MAASRLLVADGSAFVSSHAVGRVLRVAALVALLDALYVVIVFVVALDATTVQRLFQGIAAALVSRTSAIEGGWRTATLGLAIHCTVALAWTAAWAVIYRRSASLRTFVDATASALLTGITYGAVIHLTMQLVVLPLTLTPPGALLSRSGVLVLLAHLVVIGPPIVLLLRDQPGLRRIS